MTSGTRGEQWLEQEEQQQEEGEASSPLHLQLQLLLLPAGSELNFAKFSLSVVAPLRVRYVCRMWKVVGWVSPPAAEYPLSRSLLWEA